MKSRYRYSIFPYGECVNDYISVSVSVTGGILGLTVVLGVIIYARKICKKRRGNAVVNMPDIQLEELSSSSEEIYRIPITRSRAIKEL